MLNPKATRQENPDNSCTANRNALSKVRARLGTYIEQSETHLSPTIVRLPLVRPLRLPITKMAASVDEKLLKSTKFPPEFNQKVDMKKVNIEVMKKYV